MIADLAVVQPWVNSVWPAEMFGFFHPSSSSPLFGTHSGWAILGRCSGASPEDGALRVRHGPPGDGAEAHLPHGPPGPGPRRGLESGGVGAGVWHSAGRT